MVDFIGRDFGLEDGVEVEGDASDDEYEDDKRAIAAADAFEAASSAGLVVAGVVAGEFLAVGGWFEVGVLF